jgi:hypothetical protein
MGAFYYFLLKFKSLLFVQQFHPSLSPLLFNILELFRSDISEIFYFLLLVFSVICQKLTNLALIT